MDGLGVPLFLATAICSLRRSSNNFMTLADAEGRTGETWPRNEDGEALNTQRWMECLTFKCGSPTGSVQAWSPSGWSSEIWWNLVDHGCRVFLVFTSLDIYFSSSGYDNRARRSIDHRFRHATILAISWTSWGRCWMVVDKAGRMLLEEFLGATFVGVSFLQSNKQIANLRILISMVVKHP